MGSRRGSRRPPTERSIPSYGGSSLADDGSRLERTNRPSAERLEEVRRRVVAERKQQGLPETIEDPALLDRIVDILTLAINYGEDDPRDRSE